MATMTYVPGRLGEGFFIDVPIPGAGDDDKALVYDHGTGEFVYTAFDVAGTAAAAVAAHVALSNPHDQYELESANDAAAILTKLLTVDGAGSGLDADLLDGQSSAAFLLASGATTGATSSQQPFSKGISIPTQTGLISVGSYGTISETNGGLAYVTGNGLKASLTTNNSIVKTTSDAGQFIRMRYDQGISFHTNLTGATGTEHSDSANTQMRIALNGRIGIGIGTGAPGALLDVGASTTSAASIGIRQGVEPTSPSSGDIWNDGAIVLSHVNGATTGIYNVLRLRKDGGAVPTTGLGLALSATLHSSIATGRDAGRLIWEWVTATDASRASRGKLSAYSTTTEQEAIRWDGDSGGLKLGFYGVTATARQVLATGAGATVDDVITALQNLGLVKQS